MLIIDSSVFGVVFILLIVLSVIFGIVLGIIFFASKFVFKDKSIIQPSKKMKKTNERSRGNF